MDSKHGARSVERFFAYFREDVQVYEEVPDVLMKLKSEGYRIGILTDVPYGMNRSLVLQDLERIQAYVDVVVTSVDAGYRKPRSVGYIMLADQLGVSPSQMAYVGNEEKDIVGAKRVGMYAVLIDRIGRDVGWGQDARVEELRTLPQLLHDRNA